jgi:L-iditol 2-dehydrogenase
MLGTHYPGGFAQYIALPEEVLLRGFVEHIPEGLSYDHAAFAETASAVIACQKRLGVTLGTRLVIIGDGPVGCLHTEAARAMGAGLIVMVGMDKLALAKKFAPDALLRNDAPDAAQKKVLEMTDGIGADAVICAVPSIRPQQQAVDMVRKRGTVVIYGGVPKSAEMTLLNSNTIHYKEINVTGAFSYPATGLADALNAIAARSIHAGMYIEQRVGLKEIEKGMEMVQKGEALKVIVDPWLE